jgi:very-short-patch-repair endonuclease
MKTLLPVLLIVLLAVIAKAFASRRTTPTKEPLFAKIPLSKNEQPMYFRLAEAFPNDVILAQVSFNALVDRKVKHWSQRNDFNRLYTDFVLCTKAFEVKAIIELDDSSHKNSGNKDANRDALLAEAGYKVFRYKSTPDVETLHKDIEAPKK